MRFFKTAVSLALAAFAAVASAQASTRANAFTQPVAGTVIAAGETFDLRWMNIVGQRVTLTVMDGGENQLRPVRTIATNIPNNGAYTWTAPEDLPASGTYTIRISYDSNPANYNYSDRFVFTSDFVATTSAGTTTSAPATTSSASSTSAATTSASSSMETDTETTTSAPSTTVRTSSTRRVTTTSESTGEPTQGAPPSAGTATLSSPLAVIMAVLAATLFIH